MPAFIPDDSDASQYKPAIIAHLKNGLLCSGGGWQKNLVDFVFKPALVSAPVQKHLAVLSENIGVGALQIRAR